MSDLNTVSCAPRSKRHPAQVCWVCWVVITRSDFSPYFLTCQLHTGECGVKAQRGRGLIPMLCSCIDPSLLPRGDGRNHKVVDARPAGTELRAACQRQANILDLARAGWWVCGPENAIHYQDLTLHCSFQTLYLFFTLKSASDAAEAILTSPTSNPTLDSSIMLLGIWGVRLTPQTATEFSNVIESCIFPVLNFKINTCLPARFDEAEIRHERKSNGYETFKTKIWTQVSLLVS